MPSISWAVLPKLQSKLWMGIAALHADDNKLITEGLPCFDYVKPFSDKDLKKAVKGVWLILVVRIIAAINDSFITNLPLRNLLTSPTYSASQETTRER